MNCFDVNQKLNAFLDEELNISEMDAFQKHLDLCPTCKDKFKNEASFKTMLKGSLTKHTAHHQVISEVKSFVYNAPSA